MRIGRRSEADLQLDRVPIIMTSSVLASVDIDFGRHIAVAFLLLLLLYAQYRTEHGRWLTRECHTRPMNRNRTLLGEYYTTFWELREDPAKFHTRYRMRVETYDHLLSLLLPRLTKNHPSALPPGLRLNICLRYLFIADDISTIALAERIGESTAREVIKEVCQGIIDILQPIYLRKPTEEEWRFIIADYLQRWNIPNCAGAIDGKHITIERPDNSGTEYFNFKKYFSTVLMAVCDADHIFTLVHVGEMGSNGDAGIFSDCPIGQMLFRKELGLPNGTANLPGSDVRTPAFFVADDAFPLGEQIMKPFGGHNLSEAQKIFNYRVSRARRVIESAFGILINRFRVFRTEIPFQPKVVDNIVLASVILHNFLKIHENSLPPSERVYCPPNFVDEHLGNGQMQNGDWRQDPARFVPMRGVHDALDATDRAQNMRTNLCNYFMTPAGEVPWQYDKVRFNGETEL
ncbi:hypothetical protein QAD02_017069 [Eretmocerus hayati]|uniref:Uncharacterized protein n=1 Tax=Eretmocerus hayati TaxID=131215 RepID=A0ACC2PFR3_9HYME|nr:hypothetical protein QAD02_017069 [Eretmocerus hayati]